MRDSDNKSLVVVLSAGRSGTSLLMKTLGRLGMTLSENMVPGRHENPEGFFEDIDIVQQHNILLERLNTKTYLPLPDNWLENKAVDETRKKLRNIVGERMITSPTIWGFKDPRTPPFLPMWMRIFNMEGVTPTFILAVRDPAAAISSLRRQINRDEAISELQWLYRNCEALHHTAADCYVLHYEDWFTRSKEIAEDLLLYTGLDRCFSGPSVSEAIHGVVKENLNRSVYDNYVIQNDYVSMLYENLKNCSGKDFDRTKLMQTVRECRRAMHGFRGWYQAALSAGPKIKENLDAVEMKKLEDDLEQLVTQTNNYLKKNKELEDEIARLRVRNASLAKLTKQTVVSGKNGLKRYNGAPGEEIKRYRREIQLLKSSYTYRVGYFVVKAFSQPGKNTILLPYRLIRIFLNYLRKRKNSKKD